MRKVFKVIRIVIVFFIIFFIIFSQLTFCIGKFGWKIFGFDLCERPGALLIDTVYVTDENVHIIGNTMNSASSYVGYTYKIKDNTLYVGIKQNLLFGFTERYGGYSFVIEEDLKTIESIYLINKDEQKCIWTVQENKKYMEKIQKVRLYERVSVSAEFDYIEQMKKAEFVYADKELLNRIQHPTFSNELYLSKSGGYLGVAELENGEELYLSFERLYNYYDIIGKSGHYDY